MLYSPDGPGEELPPDDGGVMVDIFPQDDGEGPIEVDPPGPGMRKFYIDGGQVVIAAHLVYELDLDGAQLRVVQYTDYTAEKVRILYSINYI